MAPSNARNMRVRVDREALIQAIERKQRQCQKDYELKGDEYTQALARWQKQTVAEMEREAVKLAEDAKLVKARAAALKKMSVATIAKNTDPNYYVLSLDVSSRDPYRRTRQLQVPRPRDGAKLDNFNTVLRMLRMSKEKSISLTEAQFQAYMDGCPVPKL